MAGVGPARPAALALHGARFTRSGIRVSMSGVGANGARLDVHDPLGRRLLSADVPAGAGEFTLPGTRGLPSGLYFLRLRTSSAEAYAKVLVLR